MPTYQTQENGLRTETRPTQKPPPVTVVMSLEAPPVRIDAFRAVWQEMARLARTRPACRYFTILLEPQHPSRCTLRSEWDDASSFHKFIRESGILWMERAIPYSPMPTTFMYSQSVSPTAGEFEAPATDALNRRV
jgi:quinol monooxygenase YgiN